MPEAFYPTLRPSHGIWVAKVTVHGTTFRVEAQVPAAALTQLVRKLAAALDDCATRLEENRG